MKKTVVNISEGLAYFDVTHGYVWNKSDYDIIKKKYDLIAHFARNGQISQKRKIIDDFEESLERFRNDQTSELEPVDVTEVIDRITNSGRTRGAELIAGESAFRFDFGSVGTSQIPVSDDDSKLFAEVSPRINLKLSGYASASGAIIKHSGLWTPGFISGTFWEFAPVDTPVYVVLQMIWARIVFPVNRPLVHIQNSDFFSITHSTYTSSLA